MVMNASSQYTPLSWIINKELSSDSNDNNLMSGTFGCQTAPVFSIPIQVVRPDD